MTVKNESNFISMTLSLLEYIEVGKLGVGDPYIMLLDSVNRIINKHESTKYVRLNFSPFISENDLNKFLEDIKRVNQDKFQIWKDRDPKQQVVYFALTPKPNDSIYEIPNYFNKSSDSVYVMYMGFPMKMSVDLDTNIPTVSGFWSWVPVVFAVEPRLGADGWGFIKYKKGEYMKTLWKFLTGNIK